MVFVNSVRAHRWGPMSVALSSDHGKTWPWVRDLEANFKDSDVLSDPSVTLVRPVPTATEFTGVESQPAGFALPLHRLHRGSCPSCAFAPQSLRLLWG